MKKLFVSAIALFAAASLSAQDVTALYNEAAAAYGAKDFAGAAAKFEQVIDQGLDNPDAASMVATAKTTLPKCYFMLGGGSLKTKNYAEALNEYNPADPEILTYLNKVRVRGGLPALVPGNKTYDTCFGHLELMRECIHKERAVELYAEEHRPFDVRRWVIAGQDGVMKGDLKRLVVQQVDGVAYKDVRNAKMVPDFDSWTPEQKEANDRALSYKTEKSTTRVWEDKMYFYPFPTDEVNKGFLVQNPGWN